MSDIVALFYIVAHMDNTTTINNKLSSDLITKHVFNK
jgi:hypothetical protein